ncbi:MAG: type II toxin-antitoxin system prevent-host-death family antitoxin [Caulobacteraceae bacterium]|nr:type II toxin-antitoxin system prevent-host-death family antitoxin [Caulobacteraceae bacterium]
MGIKVNIAEAKAKLSELVARAEAGEEVLLARGGKQVARIVADPADDATPKKKRTLGIWSHLGPLEDPDLFLRPDPYLEALMDEPIWPKK